jgi:hypothetical protein
MAIPLLSVRGLLKGYGCSFRKSKMPAIDAAFLERPGTVSTSSPGLVSRQATKIDCDDNESDNYACKSKCEDISHVVFSDAASSPNGVLGWWLRRRSLLSAQAFFPGFLPTIILAYGFIFGWPRRTAGIAHRYSVSPFTVGLSLDFG